MIQAEWTRGVRKEIQVTVDGTAVSDQIIGLTYTDDINGDGSAVKLGSTCAAGVEFTVAAPSVSYAGETLAISIAGVPLGVFTVTGARMMDGRLAVTAADAMAGAAMQEYYEPSASSGTALGVIREIAAGAGLQLADMSGITDVPVTGLASGCTRREMLGRMAAVLGRNAHIDRYGKLCLRWYENSGGAVGPGDIYAGGIGKAEADYEIEKIECSVTTVTEITEDDTTTEQTQTVVLEAGTGTMGISLDCPYMTQAILDGIYRRIGGFAFRPMTLTIYGDCRIETGDILTVTDPDGAVYTVPVMAVAHTWDGGVKTVIKASGEIAAEVNGQIRGTLGQAVSRLEAELARFRNLEAENITVLRGRISQLFADWAHIGEAIIDTLEVEGLDASRINVTNLSSQDLKLYGGMYVYNSASSEIPQGLFGYTSGVAKSDLGDGLLLESSVGDTPSVLAVTGDCAFLGFHGEYDMWTDPGGDIKVIEDNYRQRIKIYQDGLNGAVMALDADSILLNGKDVLGDLNGKVSKSGDTMTGDLTLSNANSLIVKPKMDVTASGIASGQTASFGVKDKNGTFASWFDTYQDTNGTMRIALVVRGMGGTSNGIYLGVQADRTRTVSVSDADVWRKALGVSAIHSKTVTGTTDANGFINLSLANGSYIPLAARSSRSDDHVEFTTGSSSWWGRVTNRGAARGNVSVTIEVHYTDKP